MSTGSKILDGAGATFRRLNPHLYESKSNLADKLSRLRADDQKPTQGNALVGPVSGEDPCWYGAARCFEVRISVFSSRPADWDGYDFKALQDCIVATQLLPEDGWRVVIRAQIESKKAHTKGAERTVVEIIPL